MREKAICFGKSASLVGVLSEPARGAAKGGAPAVILLNSGILHHVGACRIHVRLARALAEAGYHALRFDHAGIGDSDVRRDSLPFEKGAVLDVQEAMDYLAASKGIKEFVLFGLCSGADMAFRTAGADARVVGVVQLDAFAYRTPGYYLHHYGPRLASLSVWKNFVRRRLAARAAPAVVEERDPDSVAPSYRRRFPPQAEVAASLQALADRGVQLRHILSGGQEEHINHAGQYEASFKSVNFGGRLQVDYVGDADHLFTGLQHQQFLLDAMREWMTRHWPGAPAPAETPARPREALTYAS